MFVVIVVITGTKNDKERKMCEKHRHIKYIHTYTCIHQVYSHTITSSIFTHTCTNTSSIFPHTQTHQACSHTCTPKHTIYLPLHHNQLTFEPPDQLEVLSQSDNHLLHPRQHQRNHHPPQCHVSLWAKGQSHAHSHALFLAHAVTTQQQVPIPAMHLCDAVSN